MFFKEREKNLNIKNYNIKEEKKLIYQNLALVLLQSTWAISPFIWPLFCNCWYFELYHVLIFVLFVSRYIKFTSITCMNTSSAQQVSKSIHRFEFRMFFVSKCNSTVENDEVLSFLAKIRKNINKNNLLWSSWSKRAIKFQHFQNSEQI